MQLFFWGGVACSLIFWTNVGKYEHNTRYRCKRRRKYMRQVILLQDKARVLHTAVLTQQKLEQLYSKTLLKFCMIKPICAQLTSPTTDFILRGQPISWEKFVSKEGEYVEE